MPVWLRQSGMMAGNGKQPLGAYFSMRLLRLSDALHKPMTHIVHIALIRLSVYSMQTPLIKSMIE